MTVASTGSCPTCGYPSGRCICSFGTGPWGPFTARTDRIEVRHDPELRTAVIDLLMEIARCYSDTAGALDEAVQRVKKELAR